MGRTAVIVPVPEAEELVGRWRAAHDRSAANGVPAHVTLLVPFVPVDEFSAALPKLEDLLRSVGRQRFTLGHVGVFPRVCWLAPEPASLFRDLTTRLMDAFPSCVPYGGIHRQIVPHLTVIDGVSLDIPSEVHLEFVRAADAALPIEAELAEVQVLAEDDDARWICHGTFSLD